MNRTSQPDESDEANRMAMPCGPVPHPSVPHAPVFHAWAPHRRVLIATAVSARVADLLTRAGTAVLRPELAARPAELADALVELRPHTLVIGANAVDAAALGRWAAAVRAGPGRCDADRELLLVRRGTSLAAVDTTATARLRIEVRNTPEVNARHVARFVADRLFDPAGSEQPTSRQRAPRRPGTLGLLGAGNINGRVARAGGALGWRLVVHSPSLATDPTSGAAWARHHRLPIDRVRVARTVEEVLEAADAVAVAVPLLHAGQWASAGMIDDRQLKTFTGERIVSVSEPEVFTERALLDAYDRRDLTVVLDNAPRLLAPVRELLAARIDGDGGAPRPGFALCSTAMRSAACDDDLDQAMLAVVGRADLDELTGADLLGPEHPRSDQSDRSGAGGRIILAQAETPTAGSTRTRYRMILPRAATAWWSSAAGSSDSPPRCCCGCGGIGSGCSMPRRRIAVTRTGRARRSGVPTRGICRRPRRCHRRPWATMASSTETRRTAAGGCATPPR